MVHLFRRWRRRDDDPLVLPAVMLLCGVGVMTMCALRDPIRDTITAGVFAGGAALGVLLLAAASEIDFEASRLRRAVVLPLGLACALAALLLVFGSGPGTSGVKVNLLGAQPVEVIRLLVVFALAAYFGRRVELLRELSEPATPARPWLRFIRLPRWRDVRPVAASMTLVLAVLLLSKGSRSGAGAVVRVSRDVRRRARTCAGWSSWDSRCSSPGSRPRTGRASRSPSATA